mmetsp:Transcript_14699/g.19811  ORF Transcript_14699/g.19811 Transcript_14699/m.19811 type:complete len:226 (+) Transcript_14699:213-890(+)
MTLHAHFGLLSLRGFFAVASWAADEASRNSRLSSDTLPSRSWTVLSSSPRRLRSSSCMRSSLRARSSDSTASSRSAFSRLMASRAWFCNASTCPFKRPTSRSCSSCVSSSLLAASAAAVFTARSSETSFSSAFIAAREPSHRMRAIRDALSASRTAREVGCEGIPLSTSKASASERGSEADASSSCANQPTQSEPATWSCSSPSRAFNCSKAFSSPAKPSFRSLQ